MISQQEQEAYKHTEIAREEAVTILASYIVMLPNWLCMQVYLADSLDAS